MTTASEDLTIVDKRLFKAIGLYQILNPTPGANRCYRIAYMTSMIMSFVVQITQLIGLYFAVNDLQRFAFTTTVISNGFLSLSKGFVLVTNADRLCAGLELARYEFTSCGSRDQRTARGSRAVLSSILRMFLVLSSVTGFVWALTPLSLMGDYLPVTNMDGTISRYRVTIYNIWLPIPETVYNAPMVWALIYAVEVVVCFYNVYSWMLFESYVMTMCFTLNAQFRILSDSFAAIGHRDQSPPPPHATGSCLNNCHYIINT